MSTIASGRCASRWRSGVVDNCSTQEGIRSEFGFPLIYFWGYERINTLVVDVFDGTRGSSSDSVERRYTHLTKINAGDEIVRDQLCVCEEVWESFFVLHQCLRVDVVELVCLSASLLVC